jgi:hypothetical protein
VWSTTGMTALVQPAPPVGVVPNYGTYQDQRGNANTYTGIWDVPMGWESYDVVSPGAYLGGFVPNPWRGQLGWQWSLTVIDGPIPAYKTAANIPPFDPANPVSWYLVESIPVPALVYPNGFPGRPIGVPQRVQVMPGDSLKTHAVIPSNSTVCLWARWYNVLVVNEGARAGVELIYATTALGDNQITYSNPVPVIGPSVGSLHGYTQPEASRGSNVNAVTGWGG